MISEKRRFAARYRKGICVFRQTHFVSGAIPDQRHHIVRQARGDQLVDDRVAIFFQRVQLIDRVPGMEAIPSTGFPLANATRSACP